MEVIRSPIVSLFLASPSRMERLIAQLNEMRAREVDESFRSETEGESGALWVGRRIWLVLMSEMVCLEIWMKFCSATR